MKRNEWEQASRRPIEYIGIAYNTSSQIPAGRENEKVADCEIIEVAHAIQAVLKKKGYQAELVDLDSDRIGELGRYEWIFNLTETIFGFPLRDYEIATKMEALKINFTGSGSITLRTCLDKAAAKRALLSARIDTPAYDVLQPGHPIHSSLEYPLFVKPVHEDGSIGINEDSVVKSEAELREQVDKVHRLYHQAALVEQYIEGRDITASIIGNGRQAIVLPLSEIFYPGQAGPKFLTFNGKWMSESPDFQGAKAQCPCAVSPQVEQRIKDLALRAYRLMGCRDYGRVDFRLRGECPFVLEVNPNPCINPDDSGYVRCGNAAGFSYDDLVLKILENSISNRLRVASPAYYPAELQV